VKIIWRSLCAALMVLFAACSSGNDNNFNSPATQLPVTPVVEAPNTNPNNPLPETPVVDDSDDQQPATSVLLASGGTSTSGSGGTGGYVYLQSYGVVMVLRTGTVDATYAVPAFSPEFGTNPATVTGGTVTVLLDADEIRGNLCNTSGVNNLFIGDGNGICGDDGDSTVSGLTIEAGATLVLVDQTFGYATLHLSDDMVINGTLTTDMDFTQSLDIEANIIYVGSEGMITASATTMDSDAGEIRIGNGNGTTKQIINHGTIEAKGLGTGSGGYLYFEPDDLIANYGSIDVSGGDSDNDNGGNGGELVVLVDYGDFYSSGIVLMNGGRGATHGGDTEAEAGRWEGYSAYIETAYVDNNRGRNGDIMISGTWEANGGEGSAGRGGVGGYIYLQTNAMGAVTINAAMSVRGGNSMGTGFPGGDAYGIEIYSYANLDATTPGQIRIAGEYDLRGGNGDEMGGRGGYFYVQGEGYNSSGQGSDVELIGVSLIKLTGGDGASGGSADDGGAFVAYAYGGGRPAGSITNEADIEARGGNATETSGTGGYGGYVAMITDTINVDENTIITNSGSIDISGGTGDTGGDSSEIYLEAQHVTNAADLTADGGAGTTVGGNGGNIILTSQDGDTPTTISGNLSVSGGSGETPGSPGSINIDGSEPI